MPIKYGFRGYGKAFLNERAVSKETDISSNFD